MPKLSVDQWQVLSPHLEQGLTMTYEERSIWLSLLRTKNPLLAQELERLLGDHRILSKEHFLENGLVELSEKRGLSGQVLGAYTLLSQIGRGGRAAFGWQDVTTDDLSVG